MTTRLSNVATPVDTSTVSSDDAPMTSTFSAVTARFPWQKRISNDLAMVETTRPNNSCGWNGTTARLSNDTPLVTS